MKLSYAKPKSAVRNLKRPRLSTDRNKVGSFIQVLGDNGEWWDAKILKVKPGKKVDVQYIKDNVLTEIDLTGDSWRKTVQTRRAEKKATAK